jgi:ribosomal protein S18 acetylase RimI-like enzyme
MKRTRATFITARRRIAPGEVRAVLAHAGWAKHRTAAEIERMLRGTPVSVLAKLNGRPVGFARLLTDGACRGFIEDVVVAPNLRGRGIGQRLVRILERRARAMGLPRVDLVTDSAGFWRRLGYRPKPSGTYMVKRFEEA